MSFINIEIKARTSQAGVIRAYLLANNAVFKGTDWQTDTYFNTVRGRLKLRQGNIENNLIYYERKDQAGPKQSDFSLVEIADANALKEILVAAIGLKIAVQKQRENRRGHLCFHCAGSRRRGRTLGAVYRKAFGERRRRSVGSSRGSGWPASPEPERC